MKHTIATVLVTVGLLSFLQSSSSAQRSSALHIQATTADDLRTWDTYVTQRERSGDLRMRSVVRDPALPARRIERFDQYHRGVRIWGADVVRDSERGVPLSVFGVLAPDLAISVKPALDVDAARQTLLRLATTDAALLTEPELVVLPLDTGEHRLAYTAVVSGDTQVVRAFVDAHTGADLLRYSELQTQTAVGSGRGVLGEAKKISVLQQAGVYMTDDRLRPPVLRTYDMRGNLTRGVQVLNGGALLTSDLASDTDNAWTDPAVVDAHVHVGWTYDYYFRRFGRRGLDNNNRSIVVLTNLVTQQGALALSKSEQDVLVFNAFWAPHGGPNGIGVMVFGNGIPSNYYRGSDGRQWTSVAGALDVAAHELTHAVTDSSSALEYLNESGALNEAFSDMMGTSVEFFYHPPGDGAGQADYVIGEDVVRAYLAGTLNGIRSMANPGLYGQPDHYTTRYVGTTDNWGVHTNSGIANHAFYLAIEGGTNRTSGLTVQGVGAANREQIEKVFYRAFTLLMPASSRFSTARATTIQAARDLYGAGGAVERAITQAWAAVGVFPRSALDFSFSPSPAIGTTQCQYGIVPCWKFRVTVTETGGQGITVESIRAVDLDDYGRQLSSSGGTFSFADYFRSCGSRSSQIEAFGSACANWEWNLGRRTSGYTVFEITGRSDDGTRTVFQGIQRLAPVGMARISPSVDPTSEVEQGFAKPEPAK